MDSSVPATAMFAILLIARHGLGSVRLHSCLQITGFLLNETESFSASRTSVSRSLGKALDTLSLCKHETPVEPNLAF